MTFENLAFYADLYLVKMRALARGENAAIEELKKTFPQIFEKKFEIILDQYCKMREDIIKNVGYENLRQIFSLAKITIH
jgi:hypothetical protein